MAEVHTAPVYPRFLVYADGRTIRRLINQQDELVFAALKEKMAFEAELAADREEWSEDGRGSDAANLDAEREQEELERLIEAAREVRRRFLFFSRGAVQSTSHARDAVVDSEFW